MIFYQYLLEVKAMSYEPTIWCQSQHRNIGSNVWNKMSSSQKYEIYQFFSGDGKETCFKCCMVAFHLVVYFIWHQEHVIKSLKWAVFLLYLTTQTITKRWFWLCIPGIPLWYSFHLFRFLIFFLLTERKIRLAGSNFPFAGRLEVSIAGVWGTVRNNGWNTTSSDVVCRQLGYHGVNATIYSSVERFGKGQGPVWMSGVDCKGQEERLWECPWSKIAGIYWDHDNDIGLICESKNENVGFGKFLCVYYWNIWDERKKAVTRLPISFGAQIYVAVLPLTSHLRRLDS